VETYDLVLDAGLGEAAAAAEDELVRGEKGGGVDGEGGEGVGGVARTHCWISGISGKWKHVARGQS
jgi:hypothetical protein